MRRWTGLAPWEFEFPFPAQMLYQAVASREASGVAFFSDANTSYMAVAQVTLT